MVGDGPVYDGGAAALGITTVILPTLRAFGRRELDVVLGILR